MVVKMWRKRNTYKEKKDKEIEWEALRECTSPRKLPLGVLHTAPDYMGIHI